MSSEDANVTVADPSAAAVAEARAQGEEDISGIASCILTITLSCRVISRPGVELGGNIAF